MLYLFIASFMLAIINMLLASYALHFNLWFGGACVTMSVLFSLVAFFSGIEYMVNNRQ